MELIIMCSQYTWKCSVTEFNTALASSFATNAKCALHECVCVSESCTDDINIYIWTVDKITQQSTFSIIIQ